MGTFVFLIVGFVGFRNCLHVNFIREICIKKQYVFFTNYLISYISKLTQFFSFYFFKMGQLTPVPLTPALI